MVANVAGVGYGGAGGDGDAVDDVQDAGTVTYPSDQYCSYLPICWDNLAFSCVPVDLFANYLDGGTVTAVYVCW